MMREDRIGPTDAANRTCSDEPSCFIDGRRAVERKRHQDIACSAGGLENPVSIGETGRHRLFGENVFAGIERPDRQFGMARMGRSDNDGVNRRVGKQRFQIVIRLATELASGCLACRPPAAVHANQSRFGRWQSRGSNGHGRCRRNRSRRSLSAPSPFLFQAPVAEAVSRRSSGDMPVMMNSTSSTLVRLGSMSSATIRPRRITTIRSATWKT